MGKMMEINITKFFNESSPFDYSASRAELGQNAGLITWNHAKEDSQEYNLLNTAEKRDYFKTHIRGFGAWDDDEINAWNNDELNALFMQIISGDIRESNLQESNNDWEEYQAMSEAGQISGNLFKGTDEEIYYILGL